MKNILIFAGIAGLASAIAIYFTTERNKSAGEYISDSASEAYDSVNENIQRADNTAARGFHSMT